MYIDMLEEKLKDNIASLLIFHFSLPKKKREMLDFNLKFVTVNTHTPKIFCTPTPF